MRVFCLCHKQSNQQPYFKAESFKQNAKHFIPSLTADTAAIRLRSPTTSGCIFSLSALGFKVFCAILFICCTERASTRVHGQIKNEFSARNGKNLNRHPSSAHTRATVLQERNSETWMDVWGQCNRVLLYIVWFHGACVCVEFIERHTSAAAAATTSITTLPMHTTCGVFARACGDRVVRISRICRV